MMNEKNIKKMEELLANEEFAQKIADAGSYEKAYQLFAENGVDDSYDDFMAYIDESRKNMVEQGLISESGELSEEMLGMISGGKWYHSVACWAGAVACFATGLWIPGAILAGVGAMVWHM